MLQCACTGALELHMHASRYYFVVLDVFGVVASWSCTECCITGVHIYMSRHLFASLMRSGSWSLGLLLRDAFASDMDMHLQVCWKYICACLSVFRHPPLEKSFYDF